MAKRHVATGIDHQDADTPSPRFGDCGSRQPAENELDELIRTAFSFRAESVAVLAQRIRGLARAAARQAKKKTDGATPALDRKLPTKNSSVAPSLPSTAEEELLNHAKLGDATAFGELIRRYNRRLMAAAVNIVRNQHDAEDIVQTACLNAFSHIASFRGECAFSTWMLRITVNEAIARSREARREQLTTEEIDDYEEGAFIERPLGEWRGTPEALAARRQLREVLRSELEKLPLKYSAVFVMRDVEGFSTAEVAEALHLTLTAVRVRLLRARSKLRERLCEHFAGAKGLPIIRPVARSRAV